MQFYITYIFLLIAEEVLENFSRQEGAWRQCLFFLLNSKNEFVHMYSLTILDVCTNVLKLSIFI